MGVMGQPQKHWLASAFVPQGLSHSESLVFIMLPLPPRPPELTGHEQAAVVLEAAGQPPGEQHGGHDPLLQEQRPPSHAPPERTRSRIRPAKTTPLQPRIPPPPRPSECGRCFWHQTLCFQTEYTL